MLASRASSAMDKNDAEIQKRKVQLSGGQEACQNSIYMQSVTLSSVRLVDHAPHPGRKTDFLQSTFRRVSRLMSRERNYGSLWSRILQR